MSHRLSLALALSLVACGGKDQAAPSPDAAEMPDAPPDVGGFVEATHPTQPVIGNAGGSVLTAPVVVPVFFANDATAQQQLESFLTMLASPQETYWHAVSHEYGVGALTIAPTVIATETPPTTDSALQSLVTAHAAGTGGWPANTQNTIYAVFLPEGVTLTMGGGTSCVDFGGYHSEVQTSVGTAVYAAMPRCTTSVNFPGLQYVTIATSHELLEASTDPHPFQSPAYATVDDEDAIIQLMPGPELGDMCEVQRAAYQPLVGSFMVQRTWSNESAAAGHDPCVPALTTPYVEAAANLSDVTVGGGGQSVVTRGVQVPVGTSKDVEVDLYSDAPSSDFTVVAYDVASMYQKQTPALELTLDRSTGRNGDKLKLTIKRLAASQQFGVSEFVLQTQVNGVTVGVWWGLASQ
jgi:hypothetical protein